MHHQFEEHDASCPVKDVPIWVNTHHGIASLRLKSARTCGLFRTRCQKPHTARVLLDRSSRQSASFSNPRIDSKRTGHERSWTPFRLAVNISTVSGVFGGTSRIARPVNKSITIDTSHREFLPVDFLSCPALLFPDGKVVLEDRDPPVMKLGTTMSSPLA